jgi:putative flippase GtrA
MNSWLKVTTNKYFDYSMLRWSLVGVSTTALDFCLFIFAYQQVDSVYIANLISSIIATSINYLAHHRWTFKSDQKHSRTGIKYLINLIFWWLISTTLIKSLVLMDIDPRLAKLAPLILVVPVNYFVLNLLVFKQKS